MTCHQCEDTIDPDAPEEHSVDFGFGLKLLFDDDVCARAYIARLFEIPMPDVETVMERAVDV